MTSRILLFLGLILVALALAWALVPPVPPGGLAKGAPAPDFAATDLDGRAFRLRDLRGKVVVLDFWATWCGPCRAMIPDERTLVDKFQDRPFAFIGVSADETADDLREFLKSERMPWTHVFDGKGGPIGEQYEISGWPTIFILDPAGVIRFHAVGKQPAGRVEKEVEKLLGESH